MPDLQTPSHAMGQKDGEKWTAAADSQPTPPKSDRLLEPLIGKNGVWPVYIGVSPSHKFQAHGMANLGTRHGDALFHWGYRDS